MLICNRWYLTKNPNVKLLKFFGYTRVELWTIREVSCNDTDFTTILLFWGMESIGEREGGEGERSEEGKVREKGGGEGYKYTAQLTANSLISSATLCSLS